jgi:Flp pilus assembly pilin Flp
LSPFILSWFIDLRTLQAHTRSMTLFKQFVSRLAILRNDIRGQDLIEYALMAGFVAVSAGALMPGVASSINVIFSQVNSVMVQAASS